MKLLKWIDKLKRIQQRANQVLSINNRNLGFVYPYNQRVDFPLANNKLLCKSNLQMAGVTVPDTFFSYSSFYELYNLQKDLEQLDSFVIKPANGSAGNGIIVLTHRDDMGWYTSGGRCYSLSDIKKHISDIIFGVYSHGLMDEVIIEQRIIQHEDMDSIYSAGLSDIRVILFNHQPVQAMARIPTEHSDGKANLHQGAIGLGIDIQNGMTTHAIQDGCSISQHPDSSKELTGLLIPFWDEVMCMSRKAARTVPLKYLGVDIAITREGPVMIEINARPGIEIQNANNQAMRERLENLHDLDVFSIRGDQ